VSLLEHPSAAHERFHPAAAVVGILLQPFSKPYVTFHPCRFRSDRARTILLYMDARASIMPSPALPDEGAALFRVPDRRPRTD